MTLSHGDLQVRRTADGVTAVLRIQGRQIGAASCGYDEALGALSELGYTPEVAGFSFARFARGVARAATKIAKSEAFNKAMMAASMLPGPYGMVGKIGTKAAEVIRAISGGDPAAVQAWAESAATARAEPNGPTAVAMKLAMQAVGRPRFNAPPGPPPPLDAPTADAPYRPSSARPSSEVVLADYAG